jgi:hypothetical protein
MKSPYVKTSVDKGGNEKRRDLVLNAFFFALWS